MWQPSKSFIGDYECVELVTQFQGSNQIERCIAGPRGEIWEDGTLGYRAVLLRGYSTDLGRQEQLVRFDADVLDIFVGLIEAPEKALGQAYWANRFGV